MPAPRRDPRPRPMPRTPELERPRWDQLPRGARLFRVAHAVWGAFNMAGLGYVWLCAARRRRDPLVYASAGLLGAEGIALIVGRGDCPFGPLQAQLGDPIPMFEWFLPPRAAKAAIPTLTLISVAGMVALALRRPRVPPTEPDR